MNLIEALERVDAPATDPAACRRLFLACGFTPLHLKTFVAAHARATSARGRVEVDTGLYGDLAAVLEAVGDARSDGVLAIIEWPDLDPRLGLRSLGGWKISDVPDILESAETKLQRLRVAIGGIADRTPVAVALPTLPLPPLFSPPPGQSGLAELELRRAVATFAADIAALSGVRVISGTHLDSVSPPSERLDIRSAIGADFPYRLGHASALAEALIASIGAAPVKKGIITDLDDTLWSGLLGEVGVDGISWDLDHRSHMHGFYQQFLASLASAGVLIGIASKNDPALVELALNRADLLLPKDMVYPVAAGWGRKSDSVRQILTTWNIGADSVVFIDDSPMELAEVEAAFPGLDCIRYPGGDAQGVWALAARLRSLYGKSTVQKEDALRLASIRNAESFRLEATGSSAAADSFLQAADGSILFRLERAVGDSRAFELINKTNQFNLNGRRLSEGAWRDYLDDESAFLLTAAYQDKYGDLGKIAAMLGKAAGDRLLVTAWVLSCRAFSRRIEHHCVKFLLDKFDARVMEFDYEATPRNGPTQTFFRDLLGAPPSQGQLLRREDFAASAPALFHHVKEAAIG